MKGLENIMGKTKARGHIQELTKQVHKSSELYKDNPKQVSKELKDMMEPSKELER